MIQGWTEWTSPKRSKPQHYTMNQRPHCIVCGNEHKQSELSLGRCKFCVPHVHVNHVPRYLRNGRHNPFD